jgi:hypothetical protein
MNLLEKFNVLMDIAEERATRKKPGFDWDEFKKVIDGLSKKEKEAYEKWIEKKASYLKKEEGMKGQRAMVVAKTMWMAPGTRGGEKGPGAKYYKKVYVSAKDLKAKDSK